MKVAVIQSNYIPWKGYFDIIHDVDVFYFYDNVQYTKRDWRNRNKIKTDQGMKWLTIPVGSSTDRLICEVVINDHNWALRHWKTICHYYSRAPYFKLYRDFFEYVYLDKKWDNLSQINQYLVKKISSDFLKMNTEFVDLSGVDVSGRKLERLINIVRMSGTDEYVSGPMAKDYINEKCFNDIGIKLTYKDYSGYPEYPQFHPPFEHFVSIIDLLFHTGPDAAYYIWGWREDVNEYSL